MEKWLEECKKGNRMLIEADLTPMMGDRFQPTGFADLGAALYERPDGTRMLLVESAQSVANRMEKVIIKENGVDISSDLVGIPYVRSTMTGVTDAITSTLIEPHRLNSPFIIGDKDFEKAVKGEMGYRTGTNVDWGKVARVLLKYDPNSLIHGVFFSNLDDGRVRLPRLLTGFIEAEGVREAYSGGVKNNSIDPSGKIQVADSTIKSGVYSNVPYHRVEFVANRIRAYFNLDTGMLRSYALPEAGTELLVLLSTYKVVKFLEEDLRLRTMCDLKVEGPLRVVRPAGMELPSSNDLLVRLQGAIRVCGEQGLFANPPVTQLSVATKMGKEKEDEDKSVEGQ
jgi:CRISPR-associated protein Csb1